MRRLFAITILGCLGGTLAAQERPPDARRVDQMDDYHGERVADPYRWMEAMDDPETRGWVRAQDAWARHWTATPARAALRDLVRGAAGAARSSDYVDRGARHFFLRTDGSWTMRAVRLRDGDGPDREVLSALHVAGDDTLRLSRFMPSENGRLIAWGASRGRSNWEEWRVRDLATGRDMPDRLTGLHTRGGSVATASGVSWSHDHRGFYYVRFQEPAAGTTLTARIEGARLFYHRLGTPQAADRLIFDPGDRQAVLGHTVTRDGAWQVLSVARAGEATNRLLARRLPDGPWQPLVDSADAAYQFLGNDGSRFWVYTTHEAPRGRVVIVDAARPERAAWRELIPQADDVIDPLASVTAVGGRFIVAYRRDAWFRVRVFHTDGTLAYDLALPRVGSVWAFTGRQDDRYAYFRIQEIADPGTLYRLDVARGTIDTVWRPDLPYDPSVFVTEQIFYHSTDGTRIPMFITRHRETRLDGRNPVLLYGYGAMNWSAAPWFQPMVAAWLQQGGIYALPNLRGGGEYGEAWWAAGRRRNKPVVFDDFLAAARHLVRAGYTTAGRIVANGGSASGMVAAVAVLREPELFGAAVLDYPALDMLRLEAFTGGRAWIPEFGTTSDRDDYAVLRTYSPVHTIRPGQCYPPVLVAPGERDETTVPMHAYKFVAALQHAQACDRPILLRVSWGAGHNAGATAAEAAETWADQLAFMARALGIAPTAPPARVPAP